MKLWPPRSIVAPFLLAVGASSSALPAPEQPSSTRTAQTPASRGSGELRALVRNEWSETDPCLSDRIDLVILDGSRELTSLSMCSAYGHGEARLVRDARSRSYVLLHYSEGRGTHATSSYLGVYEFVDGQLFERTRLLEGEPHGFQSHQHHEYDVSTPPAGGIRLEGRSRSSVAAVDRDFVALLPNDRRTVVAIDTR